MKPFNNFVLTTSIIVVSAILMQACTDGKSATNTIPAGSDPIPVKVITLAKGGTESRIKVSGQLTTEDETVLGFKTGGVVRSVLVKEGDPVKKGQLLATLDLTEINSAVAQAELGLEKAQRDYQRATNLYRDSVATLEQLQNSETALAVAKRQLESASFNKSFSEIHANANGFVLRKFVNAGQVVSIGDPVLQTNAVSNGKWILKVGVSDKQWAVIKLQDEATVTLDAFSTHPFKARVTRKSEVSDPATGAFTAELTLQTEGYKLATGMFGSAVLQSGGTVTSWNIPYEAVLDADDAEGFVFVTSDNKTAKRIPVVIESFNGKTMRITGGLEDNQSLIISGSAYLIDKSPIRITK